MHRLTQLLEEPPKESLQEVVFDENMVDEFSPAPASGAGGGVWSNLRQITDDSEQPSSPSEPDQFNQTRKPVKPVMQDDSGDEEASTSTVEEPKDKTSTSSNLNTLIDECSDNTPESSSNSPERGGMDEKPMEGVQQFPLSRKRSSSMRENLDSGEGGSKSVGEEEEDERGTVLQEADSTTLSEHEENGREEGDSEEGEMEEEEERDRDLEQSTPQKRMRSKSPDVETGTSEAVGGVVGGVSDAKGKAVEAVLEASHSEVETAESPDEVEARSSIKMAPLPSVDEEREREATVGELHSSSERETSTGQLERSHDLDSACECVCVPLV